MSWNIEVVAFKPADLDFGDIVPDIFERTDKEVTFEEATSSKMRGKLCIGNFNNVILLIDVGCRISGKIENFVKLTSGRELHFVVISNDEITFSVKNLKKYTGGNFFSRLLGKKDEPVYTEELDGEQRAWKYLSHYIGMDCPQSLLDSKYTVYSLDL